MAAFAYVSVLSLRKLVVFSSGTKVDCGVQLCAFHMFQKKSKRALNCIHFLYLYCVCCQQQPLSGQHYGACRQNAREEVYRLIKDMLEIGSIQNIK